MRALHAVSAAVLVLGVAFVACSTGNGEPVSVSPSGAAGAAGQPDGGQPSAGQSASGQGGVSAGSGGIAGMGLAGGGGAAGKATGKGGAAGASGATASGGASAGGAGAGGGAVYAKPIWKPFPGTTNGCTILEVLTNPADVGPLWTWSACKSPIPGCLEMSLAAPVTLPGAPSIGALAVHDDGTEKWLALGIGAKPGPVMFAVGKADGTPLTVVRAQDQSKCDFGKIAMENGHYAVVIGSKLTADMNEQGVLVGGLGATAGPVISGLAPSLSTYYPWASALLGGRAYWKYGPGYSIWSCDWEAGTDVRKDLVAPKAGGEIEDIISTPDGILFDVRMSPHIALRKLDPANPGEAVTFLADPDAELSFPVFTGSHLAWLRGEGLASDETYKKLELWASPYSADPAALAPKLVTAWPWNAAWQLSAAWGRVATTSGIVGGDMVTLHTWDIPDGTHRIAKVDPAYILNTMGGLWQSEALVQVFPKGNPYDALTIYRVPMSGMTVAP